MPSGRPEGDRAAENPKRNVTAAATAATATNLIEAFESISEAAAPAFRWELLIERALFIVLLVSPQALSPRLRASLSTGNRR